MTDYIVPTELACTTLLDAVNSCISCIGEAPVNGIDPPPTVDVDRALQGLSLSDRTLQNRTGGWSWNRDDNVTLPLAVDGTVTVPTDTFRITRAYRSQGSPFRFAVRSGKLYDRENNTFVFTVAPIVDRIFRCPWEDIPEPARLWITMKGCQKFIATSDPNSVVMRINAEDLTEALANLEHAEDEVNPLNAITGNQDVQTALYGRGGPRRN